MKSMKKSVEKWFIFFFLVGFTFFSLYPVLNIIGTSVRPGNAFHSRSLAIWEFAEPFVDTNQNDKFDAGEPFTDKNDNGKWDPGSNFQSYIRLFRDTLFLRWALNSLIITGSVSLIGLIFASLSGYALSRFKFKGRDFSMLTLMSTQMFPATMLLLPLFILVAKLQLINSYLSLIIIYSSTVLPFCIWQMKGYYDSIPPELEQAARLDGCSRFQAFYKVILPLSSPGLVITGLFSFMMGWNEYIFAAVVLLDPELYTLPLGLKSFQASMATQWGLYAAGALVVSIPVTVLFIFLARFLVSGLTIGSVKG